jgi:hypothetical protein
MSSGAEIERLASLLSDPQRALPASTFPAGHSDLDLAGLYSWWADAEARSILSGVFDTQLPELIYAGQAGASSSVAGVERASTLRSRIRSNHLSGNLRSSTFRRTLAAALLDPLALELERPLRLTKESNARLTAWMGAHLRLVTVGCPDRSTLGASETAVLLRLDPPLNLMGMPPTPVRRRLRELRGRLG